MQYAISDVHGCFDEFRRLLDLVSPTDQDTVFVMGDVIDRGPKSAEMLMWCVEEAPPNFRFLLGNHEDMAGCVVERDPVGLDLHSGWDVDPWGYNGGFATVEGLLAKTDVMWRIDVLAPWLKALRPYAVTEVLGRPLMLVHAGFNPNRFVEADGRYFHCDYNDDANSHKEEVEVGYGFGTQSEQHMIWAREGWYDSDREAPLETVFGHTPTVALLRQAASEREYFEAHPERYEDGDIAKAWFWSVPQELGRAWHHLNRHDIDCGCAYGGRLCCLRLDDFEEFYVDGPDRTCG